MRREKMFYEKNGRKQLSDKLFENPTSEYRATPFWAWNDNLDKDDLLWQIEQLKKWASADFICMFVAAWQRLISAMSL